MLNLIPFWWRWAALAALVAVACLYTGIKVAGHYQDKLAAIQAVGALQAKHTKAIEVQQGKVVQDVQDKTKSAIAASDAYYRLHESSRGSPVPSPAGATGSPPAAAETTPPDPHDCDVADGAADALLVLGWQAFYADLRAAQR